MSKSKRMPRYECYVSWLAWFKKQPGYKKHIKHTKPTYEQ